ncbi:hypothetical protein ACFL34_00655 [Candidatus Sumerlaeota bacterium]
MSKHVFLVAHNRDESWKEPNAYGLYAIDDKGAHELIYEDEDISCWQPYPLKPRVTPPILPSMSNPELVKKELALCIVQNIHYGMEGIERGEVKFIRVMSQTPRPWDSRRLWGGDVGHTELISMSTALAGKVMWGIVPVFEDGSAYFYVPANQNVYFQALDENYMELQRERTYVNYMPGETRSCIGCHERPSNTPPRTSTVPLAMKQPPVMPGPQPGDKTGKQVMHFPTYIQPLLDEFCIKCHNEDGKPKAARRMILTGELTHNFSVSYENLMERDAAPTYAEHVDWEGTFYSPPKSIGSHKSPLIRALREGKQHKDLNLPQWAFVRLATWVDASGIYYGSYWGRRVLRFREQPRFRPAPTFEEAISTTDPTPLSER